jgi:glycosyltransferase involved in cell wall biosynthesis
MPIAVSVIVPVHNRASLIGRALDSVLAQDVDAMEIVVVDDGSTDGLASVLSAYRAQIQVVRHSWRKGAAAARNTGIGTAQGRYLAFLDSDDEWLPGKLGFQLEALKTAPAQAAMCVTACFMDRGGGMVDVRIPRTAPTCRDVIVANHSLNLGTSALIERSVFATIGGFDEQLERLEDWEWLLRFSEKWDYVSINQPMAVVHVEDRLVAAEVEKAAAHIRQVHAPILAAEGRRRYRRFSASLLIERAFRAFLAKRYVNTGALLVRAAMLHPACTLGLLARARHRLCRAHRPEMAPHQDTARASAGVGHQAVPVTVGSGSARFPTVARPDR